MIIGKITRNQHYEPIVKSSGDEHLVFGFFNVVEKDGKIVSDYENDSFSAEGFEKAVYEYVEKSGLADTEHDYKPVGRLVESMFFSIEKQRKLGIDLGGVAWWGGFRVDDEKVWAKIKSGDYGMFSIGGKALQWLEK